MSKMLFKKRLYPRDRRLTTLLQIASKTSGFTLIELLVGLTISLMGLMAVSSMLMTFSNRRAAITQTMSTQDNGTMALYRLERDISQAGYGLMPLQGCAAGIINNGYPTLSPLPLQIIDGGTDVSDNLIVQGSASGSGIPGTELVAIDKDTGGMSVATKNTMTTNAFYVRSLIGLSLNDRLVDSISCTMTTVTSLNSTPAGKAADGKNIYAVGYTTGSSAPIPVLAASTVPGYLAYFGQGAVASGAFTSRKYSIANNTLMVGDYPNYTTSPLVDDIVYLKAQYGMSGTASSDVTRWVSGATAVDSSNSNQVVAIRVAVVARSPLQEKEAIDQPASLPLFAEMTDSAGAVDKLDYSVPDTHFRYRAYSTIIPLKNVIWSR